jgi:hypothetical protein
MVRSGATFADAGAEYLRYIEVDRGRKPSTLRGYRSILNAACCRVVLLLCLTVDHRLRPV